MDEPVPSNPMKPPAVPSLVEALRVWIPKLSPADARFLGTVLIAEGEALLANDDLAAAVAAAHDSGTDEALSVGEPVTPDRLTRLRESLALVAGDNTDAMQRLITALQSWVDFTCGHFKRESTNVPLGSLAGQCLSCIEMALCHPASKGGLAEQLQAQRAGLQLAMQPITDGDSGIAGDSLATAEEAYALMQGHGMGPGFKSSLKINASVFTPTGPEVGAPAPLQPTRPAPSRPPNASPVGAPVGAPPVGAIGSAAFMSTADSLLLSLENMPSQQHSQKVRTWLKTLRLHKYCEILEQLNYHEMTTMSETELERLGITAKGARTKMLKSIQGLRQRNVEAEHTIGAFNQQLQSGVYASTIKGLSDMLHPDEALFMDGPMPENFNMLSEFMKSVSKAYTGLVLQQSHLESHPSPHDVKSFFALLDKAIRHPGFSVEHKKVLFSWKNDCQRVMAKWNPQMYSGTNQGLTSVAPGGRPAGDAWGVKSGTPSYSSAAGGGGVLKPVSPAGKQKNRETFDSRTRTARSQSMIVTMKNMKTPGAPVPSGVGDPGGNPFFRADLHGFSADSVARAHSASFGSTQSAHAAGVGPPGDVRDRGASFSGDQREPSSNPFQMGAGTPYRAKSTEQLAGAGFDTFGFGQVGAASSPWSASAGGDSSNGYTSAASSTVESLWDDRTPDFAPSGAASKAPFMQGVNMSPGNNVWADPQAESLMQSLAMSVGDMAMQDKRSTAHF